MSTDPPPLAPYQTPPPPVGTAPLAVYQPPAPPTIRGAMKDELGRHLVRGMAKAGTYAVIGLGLYVAGRILWSHARAWWTSFKTRASAVTVREIPSDPAPLPPPATTVSGAPSSKVRRPAVSYAQAVRKVKR